MDQHEIAEAIRGGKIPEEFLLGYGVVSTVPEVPVSGAKVAAAWQKHKLDPNLAPNKRDLLHVFQAACRSVETRRHGSDDERVEVKVDEIMQTSEECSYQITRLVRDHTNVVINHPKAMRVTFNKVSSSVSIDPLEPEQYQELADLGEEITDYYASQTEAISGAKIRQISREMIKDLGGINARGGNSGGFYFVPVAAKPTLEQLRGLFNDLYGDQASLMTLPIVKGDTERAEIEKKFRFAKLEELDAMLAEVVNAQRKGSIYSNKLNTLQRMQQELEGQVADYEELLQTNISTVREKLSLVSEGLGALEKMKGEQQK